MKFYPDLPSTLRNPGLHMPTPAAGFGLVLTDFDQAAYGEDSHLRLVKLGVQTRFGEIRHVKNPRDRLFGMLRMTAQYRLHRLDPASATKAVACLLDDMPVLPVARLWADNIAAARLKSGVLQLLHGEARQIVHDEMWQMIGAGAMTAPLSEEEIDREARTRIFVVSSQFGVVVRMLTEAGPQKINLLGGIHPENILGSRGTFSEETGYFEADDHFLFCFDRYKQETIRAELEARQIPYNPQTSRALTDDVHYDGPLLAMAADPKNRFVVDPDYRDLDYALREGATIFDDQSGPFYIARQIAYAGAWAVRNRRLGV